MSKSKRVADNYPQVEVWHYNTRAKHFMPVSNEEQSFIKQSIKEQASGNSESMFLAFLPDKLMSLVSFMTVCTKYIFPDVFGLIIDNRYYLPLYSAKEGAMDWLIKTTEATVITGDFACGINIILELNFDKLEELMNDNSLEELYP